MILKIKNILNCFWIFINYKFMQILIW